MPKLPIINCKKLIKVMMRLNFYKHRQTGSHLVMKHLDGRRIVIPVHSGKDIPAGTLKAMLKDIKVSVEEFIDVL